MNSELQKKYGLPTATALVVGIIIGSGVFFKAEKILTATGGSLPLGILAWAIGGLILLSLGVIGEYIGKIYLETKDRPRFIIREILDDKNSEGRV